MPMAIWTTLGVLALIMVEVFSMQCLVKHSGYGLVSRECPDGTVGCRIRVLNNAISFYDRNESLVCVFRHEYNGEEDGCIRKIAGPKCWCYGSNCNEAESSKKLYENFVSRGNSRIVSPTSSTVTDSEVTKPSQEYRKPHHHKKIHQFGGKTTIGQEETKNHYSLPKSRKVLITRERETRHDIPTTTPHVWTIHVTSKHEYQNVIGSEAFKKRIDDTALPTDPPELDPIQLSRQLEKEKYSPDEYSEDSFPDLPMSESDASTFLTDEPHSPRIYTRSRDLDDADSTYYDGFVLNSSFCTTSYAVLTLFLSHCAQLL